MARRSSTASTSSSEATLRPGTLAWAVVHDKSLRAVYLTPEKLGSPVVAAALAQRAVRAYNVDEAHVFAAWGSWKPAYDQLRGRLDNIDAQRDALHATLKDAARARHACAQAAAAVKVTMRVRLSGQGQA